MNMTATLKRVSFLASTLLLLSSLTACAPSSRTMMLNNGVDTSSAIEVAEVSTPDSTSERVASVAITDSTTLASSVQEPIGVELRFGEESINGRPFNQVVVAANQPAEYKVSRLTAPDRLVLDLLNTSSQSTRSFQVPDAKFLSSVRIGAHPDKTRIVLDLTESQPVAYNVDQNGEEYIITLTGPDSIEGVLAGLRGDVVTAPVVMGDVPTLMARSDEAAGAAETTIDIAAPEAQIDQTDMVPVSMEIGEPARVSSPKLTRLELTNAPGQTPAIVAHMEAAGYFSLQRTAPSEYVLRLEGASYNAMDIETVLAPPQSGAVRSARAVRDGNDTLVRIFVQPGSELKADARRGMIVISETGNEFGALPDEARAQLTPEGEDVAVDEEGDEAALPEMDEVSDVDLEIDTDLSSLLEETPKYTGRLISLDLQDTDIDNALRIIAEVSNLNIIASDDVTGKVTLRLIDVPWDQALDVILKTNGLDKVQEGSVVRIAPVEKLRLEREALKQAIEAEEELEPLQVKYIRISYARAADLKDLVDTVVSERGTVTFDERTNQLIVKDIRRGIYNVAELVKKLDLRTPQVLLETQIVEAQRTLLRELGAEVGFHHIQSPETGNATGYNFPNSVVVGGSVSGAADGIGSSFPASGDSLGGSAISFLMDSADGTFGLDARLSALEREGRVRIVSRPAVATTNNQPATIKSVEKIRVKTPDGGLSVATGSGASASGAGGVATETIEIGIVLQVTPQASPDYYVLLDVDAKSSTLGSTIVDGIPSEIERSATSTILVSSGQTFAMGGIYKITDNNRVNGVPFLKDVPFLGHLFRFSQVDNSDEELIFFITPRIVEGSFDDAAMRVAS